jgi:hypothetical protein
MSATRAPTFTEPATRKPACSRRIPPFTSPASPLRTTNSPRRLYPSFGFVDQIESGINSNYNSFQLTVEKRLGYGLSLLASYAWSKQLTDFAPIGQPGGLGINTATFNRHFDYGLSDDDIAHAFKFSGVYQFPHVGVSGLGDKLVNGWQLSTILRWQGGFPFTVYSGYDNSYSGNGADRADLSGSGSAQLSSSRSHAELIQQWFNTALFQPNAIGTFGNTGKNILRGPGTFVTNVALVKDTKITERTGVQLRAEAFNFFNNVNFANPDHTQADGSFGQITAARDPRILQFALKLSF